MPAPRAITDALECVVSIYFANVRHRLRATFILCDELVEMTCKEKALQSNYREQFTNFFDTICKPAVGLQPTAVALGQTILDNHNTRNTLQHANAAATVDDQFCADAVLDGLAVIEHCFPGSAAQYSDSLKVAIRVIKLQSSLGSTTHRTEFETRMRTTPWNSPLQRATNRYRPIALGERPNWGISLSSDPHVVGRILDEIGIP